MHPRDEHLVEAYLVIDQPRQRFSHWSTALGPLDDRRAPPIASVAAYYDPGTDQALLAVRYERAVLDETELQFLVELALLEEIGMIQPSQLSDGDRKRFVSERLARCMLHITNQRGVINTLTELVRRARELKAFKPAPPAVRPPPIPAARAVPRGDTSDPVMLVKAKGTRDDLPPTERAQGTRDDLKPSSASGSGGISKNLVPRNSIHRAQTAQISEAEAEVYRRASEPAKVIYARYLRSGRWVALRIGALSLKGAALMTGALPRLGDHVDVAFSFGAHQALVRGTVAKVSTVHDVVASGTATFSVSFDLDDVARRQLTSLLTAARAANVMIKPPPPRAARRYPVEWTVGIGTSRGVVRSAALDVSRDGMFVHPTHALTVGSTVNFSCVLDDGDVPISGRAKVIRQITDDEARPAGLTAGYGLQITDMLDVHRERWVAFLDRIEKRSERRIVVGATPARLAELQAQLAALGYTVTEATDPRSLVELANTEAGPVDAVLIDASWLTPQLSSEWVKSVFGQNNVPYVTIQGDPKRARVAVDKLLLS